MLLRKRRLGSERRLEQRCVEFAFEGLRHADAPVQDGRAQEDGPGGQTHSGVYGRRTGDHRLLGRNPDDERRHGEVAVGAVYRSHIGDRVEDADEILSGDSRRGHGPARCRRGIDGKGAAIAAPFFGGTVSGRPRRQPVPARCRPPCPIRGPSGSVCPDRCASSRSGGWREPSVP